MKSNASESTSPKAELSLKFIEVMVNSKNALKQLELRCRKKSVFDPLNAKQLSLIDQLDSISNDLCTAFNDPTENETESLLTAGELFHKMATSLENLNKDNEQEFIITVDLFNTVTQKYNYGQRLNDIKLNSKMLLKDKKQKNIIEKLLYGEKLTFSAGYLGSAVHIVYLIALCFEFTLIQAAKVAGSIFYPISATVTTLSKLFNVVASAVQKKSHQQIISDKMLHSEELKEAQLLIRRSFILKLTSISLTALTIGAFATALLSPVGWGLVAAANVIDWIDTGLGGIKNVELELKAAIRILHQDPEDQEALENVRQKQRELSKAKLNEKWIRTSMFAMVLFACSPIPAAGPILMALGLTIFTVAAIRNIYVAIKPKIEEFKRDHAARISPPEIEMENLNASKPQNQNKNDRVYSVKAPETANHQKPSTPPFELLKHLSVKTNPTQPEKSTFIDPSKNNKITPKL